MDAILISFGRHQVMLKDLSDSKRLDSYVHSESGKAALDGVAVDSWYTEELWLVFLRRVSTNFRGPTFSGYCLISVDRSTGDVCLIRES